MMSYAIIRHYKDSYKKRIIATNLTLEEAQAWCSDPETSSSTCKKPHNKARTRKLGPWFDGYTDRW